MFRFSQRHQQLLLTAICIFNLLVSSNGDKQCTEHVHVDQQSKAYYHSFMQLQTIGVSQCIKRCKKYKLCKKIHHDREHLTCDLMMTYAEKGVTTLLDIQSEQTDSSNCAMCAETDVCIGTKDGTNVCLQHDVCPASDWLPFNHKCYFFRDHRSTTDKNIEFCGTFGAKLVRVDNDDVVTFLTPEMDRIGDADMWIAANDREVEGEFVWGSGDVALNAVWKPPFEPDGDGDCVELTFRSDGAVWNNEKCDFNTAQHVCEINFKIPPF
ncbi:brevican core protein-like [Argopecten irradians]|uniref:brevican core protein-like n=1 Tax=Argopecten irradians TaxID=31199 RepID=UPI0037201729